MCILNKENYRNPETIVDNIYIIIYMNRKGSLSIQSKILLLKASSNVYLYKGTLKYTVSTDDDRFVSTDCVLYSHVRSVIYIYVLCQV